MIKFTMTKIVDINSTGMLLKERGSLCFISFEDCAKNFAIENSLKKTKCVATRNIENLTFTFYANKKIKVVFKRRFFARKSAVNKFMELQKLLDKYGYTSYDLT